MKRMMMVLTLASGSGLVLADSPCTHGSCGHTYHDGQRLLSETIDISGLSAYDGLGQSFDQVLDAFAFPHSDIHGIGWDLQVQTQGASWLSDLRLQFRSANGEMYDTGLFSDDWPGQGHSVVPIIQFWDQLGFHFLQGPEGTFEVELYDRFVDNAGGPEATLMDGSVLYIQYWIPAPGSLAVMGAGAMTGIRRRRR